MKRLAGWSLVLVIILGGLTTAHFKFLYPKLKVNEFIDIESNLETLHSGMLASLSKMTESLPVEVAAAEAKDQFMIDFMHEATQGTFGPNGAQQMVLLLDQKFPDLGEDLRGQIIADLKSGYAEFTFKMNQMVKLRDKYKAMTNPKRFLSGPVAVAEGFPTVDLSKYDVIISDTARTADETKTLNSQDFNPFSHKKNGEEDEKAEKE